MLLRWINSYIIFLLGSLDLPLCFCHLHALKIAWRLLQSAAALASTISFRSFFQHAMRGPSSRKLRGSGLLWLLEAAICFTCCEGRVSSTLDSSLKSKAQSASEKILTELTTYDDKPNPRLSCSEGMARARHLVEQKFETLGLKPMGSEGFRFTVPETKDEQCPDGITNLIAVVEGNAETLKDEYLGCLLKLLFLDPKISKGAEFILKMFHMGSANCQVYFAYCPHGWSFKPRAVESTGPLADGQFLWWWRGSGSHFKHGGILSEQPYQEDLGAPNQGIVAPTRSEIYRLDCFDISHAKKKLPQICPQSWANLQFCRLQQNSLGVCCSSSRMVRKGSTMWPRTWHGRRPFATASRTMASLVVTIIPLDSLLGAKTPQSICSPWSCCCLAMIRQDPMQEDKSRDVVPSSWKAQSKEACCTKHLKSMRR